MHASRASFWTTHRRTILALLFGLAFSATLAYAVPPGTQYGPGDTLDPACAPGSTNCSVLIPTGGGSAVWGDITGTLSDQTDLQDVLDDKFDDPTGTTSQYIRGDGTLATYSPGTTETASNGLTKTGDNIALGGNLTGITAINAGTFTLSVSSSSNGGLRGSNSSTGVGVSGLSNSGPGIQGGSQSGYGLQASSETGIGVFGFSNGSYGGRFNAYDPSGNSVVSALLVETTGPFGSVSNGIGTAVDFSVSTDTGPSVANRLLSRWTTATSAARTSEFLITGIDATAVNNLLTLSGSGAAQLNQYGTGSITGTPAYSLAVDASGNIVEAALGGGGGIVLQTNGIGNGSQTLLNLVGGTDITLTDDGVGGVTIDANVSADTIYTADGTISGSRTIDLGGNDFNIVDTGNGNKVGIYIDTAGNISNFGSNPTDGFAYIQVNNDVNDVTLGAVDIILSGNVVIPGGASDGYVLTSDGAGNATWQATIDSPITIENTTSLFSTGLTGTGSASTAAHSLFFLTNAGFNATNAANSIFLGQNAGSGATDASNSIFLGQNAGLSATTALNSIFLGENAGSGTTINNTASADDYSILIGKDSSNGNFKNSIAIGMDATNTAANQLVIGSSVRSVTSILIGGGQEASAIGNTVFIGASAGADASSANSSLFIGTASGFQATNASISQFIGGGAGFRATNATSSVFIGGNAGFEATNSSRSTFIGLQAGARDAANNFGSTNTPNSIFIGYYAGALSTDITLDNTGTYNDISTFAKTSIAVGHRASTGGFSNSIALGAYAVNTATEQFMIGSANRPIDSTRINGSASTQCTITTGTGIACTSDEQLKTNITDLDTDTLDNLLNVRTVTYNWLANPDSPQQIGFLAQDLEQYFPQLVATDSDGYKSVYYAQMTPILVEAIREMNLKITSINDIDTNNSWRDALVDWFASATNGIEEFFAGTTHQRMLCVGEEGDETCITKDQLDALLDSSSLAPSTPTPDVIEEEDDEADPASTPEESEPTEDPEAPSPEIEEIPEEPEPEPETQVETAEESPTPSEPAPEAPTPSE